MFLFVMKMVVGSSVNWTTISNEHTYCSILIDWPSTAIKSQGQQTIRTGHSRVLGEKIFLPTLKGKPQDFIWWQGLHLYLIV